MKTKIFIVALIAFLLGGCKQPPQIITDLPVKVTAYLKCPYGSYAQVYGKIVAEHPEEIKSFGFCWGKGVQPTIDGYHVEGVGTLERFDATLNPLEFSTDYYIRGYAQTDEKTYYSELCFLTTDADDSIKVNGVGIKMIFVEGGTFWMGAQGTDPSGPNYTILPVGCGVVNANESPVHEVTLSDFWMGEIEVTQRLWKAAMERAPQLTDFGVFTTENNDPVYGVSIYKAHEFIDSLNSKTGLTFRLPTEAEWEYAARGGQKSQGYKIYSGSNDILSVAWYKANSIESQFVPLPKPVMSKQPNELGIYDMCGNVDEWCRDHFNTYSPEPQVNPCYYTGPIYDVYCVSRGGNCMGSAYECRISFRDENTNGQAPWYTGIRLVMSNINE